MSNQPYLYLNKCWNQKVRRFGAEPFADMYSRYFTNAGIKPRGPFITSARSIHLFEHALAPLHGPQAEQLLWARLVQDALALGQVRGPVARKNV